MPFLMAHTHYWVTCNAYSLLHVSGEAQVNSIPSCTSVSCVISANGYKERKRYDFENVMNIFL